MKTLPFLAALLLVGCAAPKATVKTPNGTEVSYSHPRLGSDMSMGDLEFEVDGVKVVVRSYKSETIQAFKAGVDAAKTLRP